MTEQTYMEDLERKIDQSKKSILFFTVVIFSACFLAGCTHFFLQSRYLPVLQLGAFLFSGCVYSAVMKKKTVAGDEVFSIALFLTAGLFISLSAIYFFKGGFRFMEILSLGSAFLLPNVVMEAWRTYNFILSNDKPVWIYSMDLPDEPQLAYFENRQIKIKMLIDDQAPVVISSIAPLSLKLGMVMFYIIKKKVQDGGGEWRSVFLKEDQESYKWLFYTSSFIRKRYFDPEETLFENKIKSKTTIIAKRLR